MLTGSHLLDFFRRPPDAERVALTPRSNMVGKHRGVVADAGEERRIHFRQPLQDPSDHRILCVSEMRNAPRQLGITPLEYMLP